MSGFCAAMYASKLLNGFAVPLNANCRYTMSLARAHSCTRRHHTLSGSPSCRKCGTSSRSRIDAMHARRQSPYVSGGLCGTVIGTCFIPPSLLGGDSMGLAL